MNCGIYALAQRSFPMQKAAEFNSNNMLQAFIQNQVSNVCAKNI